MPELYQPKAVVLCDDDVAWQPARVARGGRGIRAEMAAKALGRGGRRCWCWRSRWSSWDGDVDGDTDRCKWQASGNWLSQLRWLMVLTGGGERRVCCILFGYHIVLVVVIVVVVVTVRVCGYVWMWCASWLFSTL